ncbi:MAG: substrate-binding domain-containing protein [bacterium]
MKQIYSDLRRRLTSGEFESKAKLPSLRQFARSYGASKSTMQAVVQQLRHEGLLVARHGQGLFAETKPERMQRVLLLSPTVGHEWTDYTSAFASAFSNSTALSLSVESANGPEVSEQLREKVRGHLADGIDTIVFNGMDGFGLNWVPEFHERANLICFYADQFIDRSLACGRVLSDWTHGGRLAANHLAACGCKHIALVTKETASGLTRWVEQSAEKAARKAGLQVSYFRADMFDEHYSQQFKHFLDSHEDVDGVFATSDARVALLLPMLRRAGYSAPERLPVVGYFNTPWALATDPPLTSICTRPQALVEQVVDMLERRQMTERHIIRPELIVRGSTSHRYDA